MRLLPMAVITVVTATACGKAPTPRPAIPDSPAVVPILARHTVAQTSREWPSTVVPSHPEDRRVRRDLESRDRPGSRAQRSRDLIRGAARRPQPHRYRTKRSRTQKNQRPRDGHRRRQKRRKCAPGLTVGGDVESRDKAEQNSGKSETKDLREAQKNVRKSRGEDATEEPVDPKRTGNKPRFDRDR